MTKKNILEFALLVIVILSFIAVPFSVYKINEYFVKYKYPRDAQIIELTGIAEGGIWTREHVNSFNYWWKDFKKAEEIDILDNGSPIYFRVTSSDVMHSFAIPLYRIGPYDIEPGKVKEVELKTDNLRTTRYMCWQYCDEDHELMKGKIVVVDSD